jgi:hypothetical protein
MLKTVTATDSTMAFWSSTETGSISAQIFDFWGRPLDYWFRHSRNANFSARAIF